MVRFMIDLCYFMYICLCKGITDTQIKDAINNGANSFKEVRKELGIATQCCKCLTEAKATVNEALAIKQGAANQGVTPLFFPAQI